jgi:hypothetical protein
MLLGSVAYGQSKAGTDHILKNLQHRRCSPSLRSGRLVEHQDGLVGKTFQQHPAPVGPQIIIQARVRKPDAAKGMAGWGALLVRRTPHPRLTKDAPLVDRLEKLRDFRELATKGA